jgi:thiopeptide-type bacteriocin biosynthesis protein
MRRSIPCYGSSVLRPIGRFVARAPLLPTSALAQPAARVFRGELPSLALRLASPQLASAPRGKAALERYARRAAFRPTPHGLWAGVAVGELGARTRIHTGAAQARFSLSWAERARQARAALDDPALREATRLRVAPSLLTDGAQAMWLAWDQVRTVELDEPLVRVIAEARDWIGWRELRAACGGDDALDEWLLLLVDDRLLISEREPPLIGPPPPVLDAPGDGVHAVLTIDGTVTLSRAAVERAAALVPLLCALQEALAPPAAERALEPAIGEALDAVTETFGAGALDLGALALGDYGVLLDDELPRALVAPPPALLVRLLDRFGGEEAHFTVEELAAVTPPAATPPTCELVLMPAREPRGAPPGTGWLVGLHAPAGASWGRFAHLLPGLVAAGGALAELADAERRARPGEASLDVAFAPAPELADLAAHPPVRAAALALTNWPASAVTPASLTLVADGAAREPLALRRGGQPVSPSPLHRLRSTTAPPGVYRLLAGWTLQRQHAPWALALGPLAELAHVPRIVIDGFVVSPRSWRRPAPSEFRRWRRGVPRFVQVGREDELLFVDLDARGAAEELARLDGRVWEIWPPLDALPDRGGRRVEAVVALADDAGDAEAIAATAQAGAVPPPRAQSPADEWRTWKLFGPPDRAERVLAEVVAPLVDGVDGWFFLRYVDGGRAHLRLRLRARQGTLERRLHALLAPARAAGDVVSVETADYFRETARYGEAIHAVERAFESDSRLVLDLLALDEDPLALAVASLDALATGAGLDLAARRALAARRRAAHDDRLVPPGAGRDDPAVRALAGEYRAHQRALVAQLAAPPAPFAAHVARLRPLTLPPSLLPALLHLAINRLLGTDPLDEARAFYFWERALDSLAHRK